MAPGKLTEVWPCCRVKLWDAGHVIIGDESTGRKMKMEDFGTVFHREKVNFK